MKELLSYLLLGLVQGVAEALPISSSGHLLIVKTLINVNIDYDTLAIVANAGSLVAVFIYFWKEVVRLIGGFFKYLKTKNDEYKDEYKYCWMIGIGCIPAGLMGLVVAKLELFDKFENNVKIVGMSLIITSILLFTIRNKKGTKDDKKLGIKEALIAGCFQILGLFPGISRSGSTIVGGMNANLKRNTAFKYSFMLYLPLSLCALGLELSDAVIDSSNIVMLVLTATVACIATLFIIKWFRKIINEGKLLYFSIYTFIVGLLAILFL